MIEVTGMNQQNLLIQVEYIEAVREVPRGTHILMRSGTLLEVSTRYRTVKELIQRAATWTTK